MIVTIKTAIGSFTGKLEQIFTETEKEFIQSGQLTVYICIGIFLDSSSW